MSTQEPPKNLSKLDRLRLERDFQAFRYSNQEAKTAKRMEEVRAEAEALICSTAKRLIALRDSFHKIRGSSEPDDLALQDLKARVKSYQTLEHQLVKVIGEMGVQEINPVGKALDITLHHAEEAVTDSGVPADTIVRVIELGYSLNGKLIRPARVAVAKELEKGTKP